jgi:2-methylisocitrate lyase-like PEP mutase family enzyme
MFASGLPAVQVHVPVLGRIGHVDVLSARLRDLHHADEPLLLPNAWDAASARRFAALGAEAIATTSGGVARALGFDDGQRTPIEEMLAAVARIVAAVELPVTADMERGYGLEPSELAARLIATGAVGLNYEDTAHDGSGGIVDAEPQAERIAALAGAGLVVNARIDVYARRLGAPKSRLEEALRRGALYRDAGATCLFPILLDDETELTAFVQQAGAPVNGLLHAGGLSLAQLRAAGVARISVGSGLASAAVDHAAAIAAALLAGDDEPLRGPPG